MYSKETLKTYVEKINNCISWYARFPVESLNICVSKGNKKIGKVDNVSLPPIITCKHCKEYKGICYDIKACLQYPDTMKARARNYSILKRNFHLYFEQIRNNLKRKRTNYYFRFHVGGDLISEEYLKEMIITAKMFPYMTIWTYTKEYDTVNEYVRKHGNSRIKAIPKNLVIMFSEWHGLKMNNPYNFPVFYVVLNGMKWHKGIYKCPGNCDICKKNKRGCIAGESAQVGEH